MKKVNFNIRIEEELRDEFKRITEDNAQNPSALVRKWMKNYVDQNGGINVDEKLTVVLQDEPGTPYPDKSKSVASENEAKELAEKWASENSDMYVFIHYDRKSDGQQGYLNPDGYGITGRSWTDA